MSGEQSSSEGMNRFGRKLTKTYFPKPRQRCATRLMTRQIRNGPIVWSSFGTDSPKGEERIREIEFGILDGLTSDGIVAQYPREFIRRNREGKYWYRPPGGENRPDVDLPL